MRSKTASKAFGAIFFVAINHFLLLKSGIDGKETDGMDGMAGIMSRADFVMLSIRLGAASSA
jgi:hypothetical protein